MKIIEVIVIVRLFGVVRCQNLFTDLFDWTNKFSNEITSGNNNPFISHLSIELIMIIIGSLVAFVVTAVVIGVYICKEMRKPRQHEDRESFTMRFRNRMFALRTPPVPPPMYSDTAEPSHNSLPMDSYQYVNPIQHLHSRQHMENIPGGSGMKSVDSAEPNSIYTETVRSSPTIRPRLPSPSKTVNTNMGNDVRPPMLPPMYDDISEQGPKSIPGQKNNGPVASDEYWDFNNSASSQMTKTHSGNNVEPLTPAMYEDISK
ncbi:uncharacterized protein LOC120346060 [Styela clava]